MMIVPLTFVAFLAFFSSTARAACDNQCSGHGSCLTDDVCNCYDNYGVGLSYDSGDCSQRICPFDIAWVDTPNRKGQFHKYAECSGRGICDRDSGECNCFDGYEGKACKRSSCPNDCSGHGTCEYIEDLYFAATWNDYTNKNFNQDPATFPYPGWDANKERACVCDATWGDVDCSKRMCPYGTDVLDVRNNLLVSTKYQVQELRFATMNRLDQAGGGNTGRTFALTFKTRLNETFTTYPIVFNPANIPDLVHDVQLALLQLPNRVIDGITVAATTGLANNAITGQIVVVNVTFTGNSVQGPQHLLVVEDFECNVGCTPQITGILVETRLQTADYTKVQRSSNVTEIRLADYNSYECGRRGKCDYATGLCSCFLGYTGDNCNTLTTLV